VRVKKAIWCRAASLTSRLGAGGIGKGYVDYQWFKSLTDNGVSFVARLRRKAVYNPAKRSLVKRSLVKRSTVNKSTGVTSDQII
jgi:hypothetical protein